MNRRHFLKNTSLAGLTIPTLITSTSVAANASDSQNEDQANTNKDLEIVEATIDDLQQRMKSNQLTSKQLTAMYLKRIEEVDKNGPQINSFI
jgi:amidase